MTKKEKLETFDAVAAERDLLRLAVFDMACNTRFPFGPAVTVNVAKDIDGDYTGSYRVSRSDRGMPYYKVEVLTGRVCTGIQFITESDMQANQNDSYMFWRMMRHACWKIVLASRVTVEVA